jgi:outer membrane receptor for ferrienterochelin and colicin
MKTGGMGSYITREDIEQKHAAYAGELLQGVPGMRVRCGGARCQIVSVRGSCTPTFFMNGARSDLNMLQEANIQPDDIDAIEVYRSAAETPGQYSGGDECGAIVLWTRFGPSKARK